ncbi:MAG: flagellar hook-associated protein FlgK [Pirellulales bacterium]|nr:flagellar hook-associated protein FlgK [Pirellulales bacterium]
MSLFSSIRMAGNTLQVNDIALQVVGQNIANANTPGYIREEVILSPAPTQRRGNLLLGMGVMCDAVVQLIDNFLEERLRGATSEEASGNTLEQTHTDLEELIGELDETDLSTSMTKFFSAISEILNQPESLSVRHLAVLQGETLTTDINRLAQRVAELRVDVNGRIQDMAADMNRLIEEIRVLNVRIAETEGGNVSASDAVGLRDQRLVALTSLAEMINIRVVEQQSGCVTVYAGGDYLVFEGVSREVEVHLSSDRGLSVADIYLTDTQAPLDIDSGMLNGLITSRDDVLGDFLDRLDEFARTFIFEFNKVFSGGQGMTGFDEVTGTYQAAQTDVPLNQAGLPYTPTNGSFEVLVHNNRTGLTQTTDVLVDLNGIDRDMTLEDLRDTLNAIDGISAEITLNRALKITSTDSNQQFGFGNDTSGVLAALGINTFFDGLGAMSLSVNSVVRADSSKFTASRGGIGADTDNAVAMANFNDMPIASEGGVSLNVLYDQMIGDTTQGATVATAAAESARVYRISLEGQKMAMSGVNLDEEAVRMLAYQRSFQASARYIAALDELFEMLVSL